MSGPVIYYDGLCALCDGFVRFVEAHDPERRFRFAPLQGVTARERLAGKLDLEAMKTVVLETEDGGLLVRSDAALAIAARLRGPWRLLTLFRVVPRPLRDAVYDFTARRRARWFGRLESCRLPAPESRERYLA